jgi:hypothetical protein
MLILKTKFIKVTPGAFTGVTLNSLISVQGGEERLKNQSDQYLVVF